MRVQLRIERDAAAFVCQSCWRQADDFHQFYQSVLLHYQQYEHTNVFSVGQKTLVLLATAQAVAASATKVDNNDSDNGNATACRLQSDSESEADVQDTFIEDRIKMESSTGDSDDDEPQRLTPKRTHCRTRRLSANANAAAVKMEPNDQMSDDAEDAASGLVHKCSDCDKAYTSAKWLASHRAAKHASDDVDGRTADGAVSQRRIDDELMCQHMSMVCGECGTAYKSFAEAKRHHRTVHRQAGYVECCGRKFSAKDRAVQHCRWHENPQQFE